MMDMLDKYNQLGQEIRDYFGYDLNPLWSIDDWRDVHWIIVEDELHAGKVIPDVIEDWAGDKEYDDWDYSMEIVRIPDRPLLVLRRDDYTMVMTKKELCILDNSKEVK